MEELDPDLPAKKKEIRKRRSAPRIDLNDPEIHNWVDMQRLAHPLIFLSWEIYEKIYLSSSAILEIDGEKYDREWLLRFLPLEPLYPTKKRYPEKYSQDDWEGWYAFYIMMQFVGKSMSEEILADLTLQPIATVHRKFRQIKKRILQMKDNGELTNEAVKPIIDQIKVDP